MSTPSLRESATPAPPLAGDVLSSAPSAGPIGRPLRLAALLVAVFALFGLAGQLYTIASGLGLLQRRMQVNIFFRLYAMHERPFLVLLLLFTGIVGFCGARDVRLWARAGDRLVHLARRIPAWAIALGVLLAAAAGTLLVMHGIGLSMDEAAATFQARIFASGRVTAYIPTRWQALAPWMTPIFIVHKPEAHLWVASYLPVYAAIRAALVPLRAEWLVNPLLAAASVLLLDRIARRLWPGENRRRLLALAFLVTSAQFLVTSMSGYSMPAHLCLNLLWLLLYLRDDRVGYLALPVVGVLAMGLHTPFPHALFVVPFLVRLLRRRQFGWLGYMAVVYLAGAAVWLRWLKFTGAGTGGDVSAGSLLGSFQLPDATMRFTHGLNLALLLTWQTPVLAVMLVLALLAWRDLQRTERDLAAGLLLTFAFYLLFPVNQGHGWGYRYIYGVLGNVMLLGATGAALAAREMRQSTLRLVIAGSLLVSVAFQLPLRLRQTEAVVRPYASALAFIAGRPAAMVAVDFDEGWYATDLVRNDPLFQRGPVAVLYHAGWGPPLEAVPPALRDSVYLLSRSEMARFGIPLLPPRRPAAAR